MRKLGVLLVITCLAPVFGRPGLLIGSGALGGYGYSKGSSSGSIQNKLVGVPDVHGFGAINYPNYGLQEFGSVYEGSVPPKIVKINTAVAIQIPKPYPVKVPHNVPIPIPVSNPYPVPVTKILKVPQPVPVEVIKTVHVPVEVPKPYPVPENEYSSGVHNSFGGNNEEYGHYGQQLANGDYAQNDNYGSFGQGGDNYNSHNNQASYGNEYEEQEDKPSAYPAPNSNEYEVKQNQEQNY